MQNTERTTLSFWALIIMFLAVPFFEGGREITAFIVAFICLLPIAYFMLGAERGVNFRNKYILSFIVFLFAALISTYFAADFYASFAELLWWWIYFIVFVGVLTFVDEKRQKILSYSVIALAAILGLVGVYYFINDTTGYLRLRSVFLQHNAFGGFMLIPTFLSIGYYLHSETRNNKLFFGTLSTLLMSVVILTFSRGTWLSFILALAILLIFSVRKGCLGHLRKVISRSAIIALAAGVLSFGIFSLHANVAQRNVADVSSALYNENAGENAVTLRLNYWQDALQVIRHGSVVGAGLDNYAQENRKVRTVAGFFSVDPHNGYLKYAAEVGIGSIALFAFVLFLLIEIWKCIRRRDSLDYITLALGAGLLAVLIHSGMEIDWRYPANLLMFFVFSAVFLYRVKVPQLIVSQSYSKYILLLTLTLVLLIPAYFIFRTENHLLEGMFYQGKQKNAEALGELVLAHKYNYIKNPDVPQMLGLSYLSIAQREADPKKRAEYISLAKENINAAIALNPENSNYYVTKLRWIDVTGEKGELEETLKNAVHYGKSIAHVEAARLAQLYLQQGRNEEAKALLLPTVKMFNDYSTSAVYKNDPDKTSMQFSMIVLFSSLMDVYEKEGKTDEAKKIGEEMTAYLKR